MKSILIALVLFSFVLSACSLPTANTAGTATPTVSNEALETQVSQLLTNVPSTQSAGGQPGGGVTVIPSPLPTQPVLLTATQLPTITQAPSSTPAPTDTPTSAPILTATPESTQVTATSAPTNTPLAEGTLAAGDPRAKLGNPTWQDTFANSSNWPLGANQFTEISISNNTLQLTGLQAMDGWRLTWAKVADFYLEATIQPGTCDTIDRYGLIVRVPDIKTANSGYLVSVSCDGQYALRKWDGVHMTNLIPWTASDVINAGSNQTNRVGLLAKGSQMTVYINGTALKSATDSDFSSGYFGLFIGALKTPKFTITVSQIAYWENPNL